MKDTDSLRLASPQPCMNAFQRQCSEAIGRVLAAHDLAVAFVSHAPAEPAEDNAALFLRADLVHGDRHYKVCVYPDGAGANIGSNWYVLEAQQHPTSEALIRTFCDFLAGCFRGLHPVAALEEARR